MDKYLDLIVWSQVAQSYYLYCLPWDGKLSSPLPSPPVHLLKINQEIFDIQSIPDRSQPPPVPPQLSQLSPHWLPGHKVKLYESRWDLRIFYSTSRLSLSPHLSPSPTTLQLSIQIFSILIHKNSQD